MLKTHFIGFIFATLFGSFTKITAAYLFPSYLVGGYPAFNVILSIIYQVLIYPPLAFSAWYSKNFVYSWLKLGWNAHQSVLYETLFFYAFFGYLAKDMRANVSRQDPLLFYHHIICMIGTFSALVMQNAIGGFILQITVLELGSMFYNLKCLLEKFEIFSYIYWVGMTASNLGAATFQVWYITEVIDANIVLKVISSILIFGLIAGRQREVILQMQNFKTKAKGVEHNKQQ